MTRHSKVFVPVSVDERNPDVERYYHVYRNGNITPAIHFYYKDSNEWSSKTDTWLEEKENVYLLTEDDAMFLDGILAHVEDYWHGEEGKRITEMRASLQSVYKTNPQT